MRVGYCVSVRLQIGAIAYLIECCFSKLKQFRRVATRYEKADRNYLSMIGFGHIPGALDEVRWGDTFADVTPFLTVTAVPEPAALPLFAAGLLGMILMGGRSRQQRRRLGTGMPTAFSDFPR